MLVIEGDHGASARCKGKAWRNAVALEADAPAEAVCVLEHAVYTKRQRRRQWLIQVRAEPAIPVRASLQHRFTGALKAGVLGDAVDDAATAPATEHHSVWPLQRLDPLDVVQVAVVLHIVAYAVDVEIGRRTVPPNDDLIAIVLALV